MQDRSDPTALTKHMYRNGVRWEEWFYPNTYIGGRAAAARAGAEWPTGRDPIGAARGRPSSTHRCCWFNRAVTTEHRIRVEEVAHRSTTK